MDDAVASGRNLGLKAAVRHALDVDGWRRSDRPRRTDTRILSRKEPGGERDGNHTKQDVAHPTIICRPADAEPRTCGPADPRTREVSSNAI